MGEMNVIEIMEQTFTKGEQAVMPPLNNGQFEIMDESSATWALGKILSAQNEIKRRKEQSKEYIQDAENNLKRLEFCFKRALEGYLKENMPEKKKSLKLNSGTIGVRKVKSKIVVDDEAKAVEYLQKHEPDALQVYFKIIKSELDDYVERTGELPEGCYIEGEQDKFYLK